MSLSSTMMSLFGGSILCLFIMIAQSCVSGQGEIYRGIKYHGSGHSGVKMQYLH